MHRLVLVLVPLLLLGACQRAGDSVIGSWTAAEAAVNWTLDMASDSTYAMRIETYAVQGLYAAAEEEGVVVLHGTEELADLVPGGLRAHVERDTLRLCDRTRCTDMIRVLDR